MAYPQTWGHPNEINVEIRVNFTMPNKYKKKQDISSNKQRQQVKQVILAQLRRTLTPHHKNSEKSQIRANFKKNQEKSSRNSKFDSPEIRRGIKNLADMIFKYSIK